MTGERGKGNGNAAERTASPGGGATVEQAGELRSARIESLRALAALGVLAGHVYGTAHGYDAFAILGTFTDRFLLGGGFGVFLFFALSGYLIYWPFARAEFGGGAAIDLRRYALNRALRILPLYWISVVVVLLWQADGGSATEWWRFMLFAENYFADTVGQVNGVLWSVVVEVWFYATLPLVAYVVSRLARGSRGRAALLVAALGGASLLLWYLQVYRHPGDDIWRYNFPTTYFFFTGGMLVALLRTAWQERPAAWLRGPLARRDLWLLASIPIWLVIVWRYQYTWLAVLPSSLIVAACVLPLRDGPAARALQWRPLALVGVASYSLYIWHVPILQELDGAPWLPSGALGLAAVAVPLTLAAAAASYLLIESPFLRMRRRWSTASAQTREPSRAPAPAAAAGEVPAGAPALQRTGAGTPPPAA